MKNERGKLPVKAILIVLLVLFLAIDAILAGYYLYSKRASSQDDEVSDYGRCFLGWPDAKKWRGKE